MPVWTRGRAATGAREQALDVVVLDVSLRQGLVALQHLGRSGHFVGAVECESTKPVPAFASRLCSARAIIPDRETQPDRMLDALIDLIRQRSVRAVIPVHDGTIEAIKTRRDDLDKECAVALAAPAALDAAIDKEETLRVAADIGMRIPRCVRVDSDADIRAAIAEIGLPAVAKPTRSWVTNDGNPLRLSPAAVIDLEESRAAVAALREVGSDVLFQEWIPGAREAVSFVYANGRYWGEFAQVARRMVPILGGNSVARESIDLPDDAAGAARRLVAELGLEGYAEVEFRRDAAGVPVLMEINPRLSASVDVAIRAGVNFPRLIYEWALGGRLDGPTGYRTGVKMRWLAGDIRWVVDSLRSQDRPDAAPMGQVLWAFARDFARPAGYDYLARDDLRPAAIATWGAVGSTRRIVREATRTEDRRNMKPRPVDVAIVGAGPYGLSLAAHLAARGVDYRIFGSPMHTWRSLMPEGMNLRSPGFGSDLSDPARKFTLARYWSESDLPQEKLQDPVPLDTYLKYTQWFMDGTAAPVEDVEVRRLARDAGGFLLDLETGETVRAHQVVLAVGLTHFAHVPTELAQLPAAVVSHSSRVTQPGEYANRDVVVVGAGQSALETAALLHEQGAHVRVVARCSELTWTGDPIPPSRGLVQRLRRPDGRLCAGWGCIGFEYGAALFHRLPEDKRMNIVATHFGPMGAWWLRERLADVPMLLGRSVANAAASNGDVELELRSTSGTETVRAAHVVAATGYRVDLGRLAFVDEEIRRTVRTSGTAPALSRTFESSAPGLYFIGAASSTSFGPVTRFVAGAKFTARTLSRHLA